MEANATASEETRQLGGLQQQHLKDNTNSDARCAKAGESWVSVQTRCRDRFKGVGCGYCVAHLWQHCCSIAWASLEFSLSLLLVPQTLQPHRWRAVRYLKREVGPPCSSYVWVLAATM
jgi:hypothetical protein